MLKTIDAVVLLSCAMLIANLLMFIAGRHLRSTRPLVSLALIFAIISFASMVQAQLTGNHIPFMWVTAGSILLGVTVIYITRHWNPAGHAAFAITVAAAAAYLAYVADVISSTNLDTFNLAFSVLLLLLHSGTMILLVGTMYETTDVICRTRWVGPGGRNRARGIQPKVSIHVPIHAEPPQLVIATLEALANLDYPNYEVLVIDNNTVDESLWRPVEAHCQRLGERFRFFHLLPWPGYKSGALNFATAKTACDADLIAIVDADYVVQSNFLKELVGHFDDPQVAFVQTPQDYRDSEERGRYGRALYRSYRYFFDISMPSRNETNSIIYVGTMGLIRKSALVEVGGWSEWCITEDAELSLRLLAAGYRSVFVDETFGHGLMPMDLAGFKKQRFRWAFGGMQLLRLHFGVLVDPRSRLTTAQRLGYLNGGLQWLSDLLAIAYTGVLFIGASSLIFENTWVNPVVTLTMVTVAPLFLALSVVRFLWAFRLRNRCSWRDALDAMSALIGLTWVVGVACLKGLLSRNGVFLRTPKQGSEPTLKDALNVVRVEAAISFGCLITAGCVLIANYSSLSIGSVVTIALLLWQAATFGAGVRLGAWSHAEAKRSCAVDQHCATAAQSFDSPGPSLLGGEPMRLSDPVSA